MWNFKVENLGKVAAAEISMAPLVMLVGQNNTGKSYIATLAWALTSLFPLLSRDEPRSRRPTWFKKFIGQADKQASIEIGAPQAEDLIRYLNQELSNHGSEFLRDVFLFSAFERTTVTVAADSPFKPFRASLAKTEAVEAEKSPSYYLARILELDAKSPSVQLRFPARGDIFKRVEDRLFIEIIYRTLFGQSSNVTKAGVYIPAARTGLMLALRALIGNLFESEEEIAPTLPRPISDFLQRLAFPANTARPDARQSIAEWLQNEIMHGKIEATHEEIPSFSYVPEESSISVPLHATSSMITELTPFLLLMRNRFSTGLVIFEEPEAHLHLSAQRSMARALARLLNAGTRLIVTTHSDTFVQQINNLMHLYAHSERDRLMQKLGYQQEDLINPEMVKAYEFVVTAGATNVTELMKQTEGFAVPSLNSTLINLADETISLDDGA